MPGREDRETMKRTAEEIAAAKWYREQAAWNEEHAKRYTERIAWCNENLARERKSDREFMQAVWARGVLTKWEMAAYGDPKAYRSSETEYYLKQRRQCYKWRKHYRDTAEHCRRAAAMYEA